MNLWPISNVEWNSEPKPRGNRGIYESYYFRGNSPDGTESFWLKHNLIEFKDDAQANKIKLRVDLTVILFDNILDGDPRVFSASHTVDHLSPSSEAAGQLPSWKNILVSFQDGSSFFELTPSGKIRGAIRDELHWEFQAEFLGGPYFHFDRSWFYQGFFPRKKILTVDSQVKFQGGFGGTALVASRRSPSWQGTFLGMNGHNWGKEHARKYAYANCNEWLTPEGSPLRDTFFDGFSAKIALGPFESPYLSAGSLQINGEWFHFNSVLQSWKPRVRELDEKFYSVVFRHADTELDVTLDGRRSPWVRLVYDHPSRKKSEIFNTKTAAGHILLKKWDPSSRSWTLKQELHSERVELETGFLLLSHQS